MSNPNMKETKKILICENEEILLTALKFRLQKQGYELFLAANEEEARRLVREAAPDLIVTDIGLPDVNGLDLIAYVRQECKLSVPIILIAPLDKGDALVEAVRLGATDFVTKPFKPVELVLRIRCIFQAQQKES
jgi:two-component system, OmpR family, response regulator VicR